MSAILFLLHVVERIMARGLAIMPTPTAVSNKVVSLQAAMSLSILFPVMVLIRLLQMKRRVVLRESRPSGSIHVQSVPNPFARSRKEVSVMFAVNGIALNASIWTTDYTRSMDLLMKHGTARIALYPSTSRIRFSRNPS